MRKLTIDEKLGVNRFYVDQHNPHITINNAYDNEDIIKLLVSACPAGLYGYEDKKLSFNHEGCLECGTCRVLSKGRVVKTWEYPAGSMGIEFTQG